MYEQITISVPLKSTINHYGISCWYCVRNGKGWSVWLTGARMGRVWMLNHIAVSFGYFKSINTDLYVTKVTLLCWWRHQNGTVCWHLKGCQFWDSTAALPASLLNRPIIFQLNVLILQCSADESKGTFITTTKENIFPLTKTVLFLLSFAAGNSSLAPPSWETAQDCSLCWYWPGTHWTWGSPTICSWGWKPRSHTNPSWRACSPFLEGQNRRFNWKVQLFATNWKVCRWQQW